MLTKAIKSDNIFLYSEDKKKKRYMWALIDEMGNTMMQTYAENYPKEFVKLFS